MHQRLKQPLGYQKSVRDNGLARLAVISYDSIYNLLYKPCDEHLTPDVVENNAKVVLDNLRDFISHLDKTEEFFE